MKEKGVIKPSTIIVHTLQPKSCMLCLTFRYAFVELIKESSETRYVDFPKVDNLDVHLDFSTLVTDLLKLCVLTDEAGL